MSGPSLGDLLTPEALQKRWGCGNTDPVWRAVHEDINPLPFLYLGRGSPTPNRRGRKGLYRFRPGDVEAWEAGRVQVFGRPAAEARSQAADLAVAHGHDGKIRGGRRRERR